MVKRGAKSAFPPEPMREPVIYGPGRQFKAVTDIRRADTNENKGWVVLELEGKGKDIKRRIAW